MRGKLVGLFAVVLLALVGLLGRITYINATSGKKYKKQVLTQAQQKYQSSTLPAKRGDIYDRNGNPVDHCDPYGFGMELRPSSASIIRDMSKYKFKDSQWLQSRSDCRKKPLNIYEIHFGSFRKPSDKADGWYNYEEMIDISS